MALIQSHLNYGSGIWGDPSSKYSKNIHKIQKKAIRNILNTSYREPSEPLFKKLKILKFHDLININRCKLVHKYVYNPIYSQNNQIFKLITSHERLRRNLTNIEINLDHKNSTIHYKIPSTWNSLQTALKSIKEYKTFSKEILETTLKQY